MALATDPADPHIRVKIAVEIPRKVWTSDFSRRHPELLLKVHNTMEVNSQKALADFEIDGTSEDLTMGRIRVGSHSLEERGQGAARSSWLFATVTAATPDVSRASANRFSARKRKFRVPSRQLESLGGPQRSP